MILGYMAAFITGTRRHCSRHTNAVFAHADGRDARFNCGHPLRPRDGRPNGNQHAREDEPQQDRGEDRHRLALCERRGPALHPARARTG